MSAARLRRLAGYTITLLVLGYLLLPLLLVLPMSLTSGHTLTFPVPGYSLRWYHELIADARWLQALKVSVGIGLASTLIALTLGIPAAIGLVWGRFPGRALAGALLAAPMATPIVVVGVAAYYVFARLGLIGTRLPIVLIHAALALPVVISTVAAALTTFDRTLLRASASLGAGPLRSFFQILLPLIFPGVAAGALIGFTLSFDEVVVAAFLSSGAERTLPRMLFSGVRENISPAVAAVAVVLMVGSALLLLLFSLLRRPGGRS